MVDMMINSTGVNVDNKQEVHDITYELIRIYAGLKTMSKGGS